MLPMSLVGLFKDAKILASHFPGFGEPQHPENRRGDVPQGTVGAKRELLAIFRDNDEWDGIGGVRGMRAAGCGINHHFGVAVVRSDKHRSAFGTNRNFEASE